MKFLFLLLFPVALFAQNGNLINSGSAKALTFVNSLNEVQHKKAVFPFNEMNRYEWHFLPAAMVGRTGIAVKDLDSIQKENLHLLLQAMTYSLSIPCELPLCMKEFGTNVCKFCYPKT